MTVTLKSRLPQIAAELPRAVDRVLVAGAYAVAASAQQRLEPHRRTGELEQQTHVDESQREGIYVVAGDPSDPSFAFWGHMLEHGTSHSAPHPFLVPALEGNRDEIVTATAAALRAL